MYDHFPQDPSWQLLDRPLSWGEYTDLVYLRPLAFRLGVSPASHHQGSVEAGHSITLSMHAPANVSLTAALHRGEARLADTLAFAQREGRLTVVRAVFPQAGAYTLRVYGKLQGDPGPFGWALDYGISAAGGDKSGGFPLAYDVFSQANVVLFEPCQGILTAGATYRFQITIPGATAAAIETGGSLVSLASAGTRFTGHARVSRGPVTVLACFAPEERRYSGLLRYTAR